jgi:acyl-CoA hydrolase
MQKTPADSALEQVLAFSTDAALRGQYVNNRGDVRFGLVLELLDGIAGPTARRHADADQKGITVVTAAVDRIDVIKPIRIDQDLTAKAMVNYAGTSSMEVGVRLESGSERVASAHFTMVALDGTLKPTPVPQLAPATDLEKQRWTAAEQRRQERLARRNAGREPLTPEEAAAVHNLRLQHQMGRLPGIPLASTERTSLTHMYPQNRNPHNTIFGGYLMRIAYEHAWNTAYLFSKQRPFIASVDSFQFIKPVELGALVELHAGVRHVGKTSMQVEVDLKTLDPAQGSSCLRNTCWFTFVARDSHGSPIELPKVYPDNPAEDILYMEGRRRYLAHKQGCKP